MKVTSRFKGLDLIEYLKNYGGRFLTLYRRRCLKLSPRKRKAKWMSEEALQIAVKRREVKSQKEKERYKHLNAEFQRKARREKKDFLSNQCKEIEENNRMSRDLDNRMSRMSRESLGISSRKLAIPREHFMQRWTQ